MKACKYSQYFFPVAVLYPIVAGFFLSVSPSSALNSSDLARTDLSVLLGADRFYQVGIDGSGASAAVIEGGLIWNGDAATAHVNHTYAHSTTWSSTFGDERDLWDRHATWTGSLLGGRGPTPERTGIAPGVDLRSGATARRWVGSAYTSSWAQTATTVVSAYRYFAETAPVDVINSSWGFSDSSAQSGVTVQLDALAYQNPGTLFVAASGNSGFSSNSVVAPAAGMNVLSVGGLAYADAAYDVRWGSSGQGLSNYFDPVNGLVLGVRSSVDILAPSQNIVALRYGGQTGGNNTSLTGSFESTTRDSTGLFGTSFSSPIVAGAASLLYSLSRETMPENEASRDGRVIKAILLNSAAKLEGWDPHVYLDDDGIMTTTQGLDAAQGAGRLDLNKAFDQYASIAGATAGVIEENPSDLSSVGWDLRMIDPGQSHLYDIGRVESEGGFLTSTLTWHRERRFLLDGSFADLKQANLDLLLWVLPDEGTNFELIAHSISTFNTTEHLALDLYQVGEYRLEVRYRNDTFKTETASDAEQFGFAWNLSAVPEPTSFGLFLAYICFLATSLARKRKRV